MLINAAQREEKRVAVVEEGRLEIFVVQSTAKESIRGNIYKAVVVNVEQSLQAAFVNFGMERAGFLPLGEVRPELAYKGSKADSNARPRIQDLLRRGQEILVQVVKDEIGAKGAALSTYPSIPGRYLVLAPGSDQDGISRKIEEEAQRQRLKKLLAQIKRPDGMSVIVRTAGDGITKTILNKDLQFLVRLWEHIQTKAEGVKGPKLIFREQDFINRCVRDYFSPDIQEIVVDDPAVFERVSAFMRATMPRGTDCVRLHDDKEPLFSVYNLESQIDSIYRKNVDLPSGGAIVIEQTEALVSIDVNSGKATQEKGIEKTALRSNLEAAQEVARQLRLRDLGGLVVVDFIDMRDAKHLRQVEKVLKYALKRDRAKTDLGKISKFGLLELSRQRLKSSLREESMTLCSECGGSGYIRSVESRALSAVRRIQTGAARLGISVSEVHATLEPEVALYLLNHKRNKLQAIERDFDLRIIVQVPMAEPFEEGTLGELKFVRRSPEEMRAMRVAQQREQRETPAPLPKPVATGGEAELPVEAEDSSVTGDEEGLGSEPRCDDINAVMAASSEAMHSDDDDEALVSLHDAQAAHAEEQPDSEDEEDGEEGEGKGRRRRPRSRRRKPAAETSEPRAEEGDEKRGRRTRGGRGGGKSERARSTSRDRDPKRPTEEARKPRPVSEAKPTVAAEKKVPSKPPAMSWYQSWKEKKESGDGKASS